MTREVAMAPLSGTAVRARYVTTGVLLVLGLIILAGSAFWQVPAMQRLLSVVILPIASAAGAIMSLVAWRRQTTRAGRAWLFIGAAAVLATVSEVGSAFGTNIELIRGIHLLWLASYGLVLAAVVTAVHQREGGQPADLVLDVALVLTAATLVILQWAPGAHYPGGVPFPSALLIVVLSPAFALSALVLVAVLLSGPRNTQAPGAVGGMAAGVLCLMISTTPFILDGGTCCHPGSVAIFPAIGTWLFFVAASSSAWAAGDLAMAPPSQERLRQLVAPLVAIVLAAVAIDAGLRPPLEARSGVALGVLGALIALRLTELLEATRTQSSERRELAHTRALVEVSRALAGKNDLDSTLQIVTHWAAKVLNARAAAVELLSTDSKKLILRAAYGLPDHAVGMEFPVEASFTGWVILNGERVTTRSNEDPFITADSAEFLGDSPVAAVPLRYRDQLLGVLSCVGNRPFEAADLDLLRAFASQTAVALEDARLFEQVHLLSMTDPLTGLANRRQLDRELAREFSAAQRGRRLVAVMFDLDDFKQHNDTFGHVAGDRVLRRFGDALTSMTRTMNFAARYGGDEFFALLADSDVRGAQIFVARVTERFQRLLDRNDSAIIQVSAGIAEHTMDMTAPEDLIAAADRALYVAKESVDISL